MVAELLVRFLIGGLVVSAFAVIGDILRPKSFAGIFGGAPSVALATIGLTLISKGTAYTALEGRSMMAGAAGFLVYSFMAGRLLLGPRWHPMVATGLSFIAWFALALGLWVVFFR